MFKHAWFQEIYLPWIFSQDVAGGATVPRWGSESKKGRHNVNEKKEPCCDG